MRFMGWISESKKVRHPYLNPDVDLSTLARPEWLAALKGLPDRRRLIAISFIRFFLLCQSNRSRRPRDGRYTEMNEIHTMRLSDYSPVGKDFQLAIEKGLADADWHT
jgi:hypothetical protein